MLASKQELLDIALHALTRRIEAGEEFPDACWSVASRQNVSYEKLQEAYDAQCVNTALKVRAKPSKKPLTPYGRTRYVVVQHACGTPLTALAEALNLSYQRVFQINTDGLAMIGATGCRPEQVIEAYMRHESKIIESDTPERMYHFEQRPPVLLY